MCSDSEARREPQIVRGNLDLNWRVELSDLCYGEAERLAVADVLNSNWLTMGPRVEELERALSAQLEGAGVVLTSSCTTALQLALLLFGVGAGDEVIVPSLSFVATANVVRLAGATPVFADIVSVEEPTIDPEHVAALVTERTSAVIPMHYGGSSCQMSALLEVARRSDHAIRVVEDAAHAFGGMCDSGEALGTLGDAGAFSFFSNKNLATGEGGALVTRDTDLEERARRLRSHGLTSGTWVRHASSPGYDVTEPGLNARPTEITAALGLAQLSKFSIAQDVRRQLWEEYVALLGDEAAITIPFRNAAKEARSACHIFPILLPDSETKALARSALREAAIQTSHHYEPIHRFSAYSDGAPSLPRTEEFAERELTLPLHPNMTTVDVALVAETLLKAL